MLTNVISKMVIIYIPVDRSQQLTLRSTSEPNLPNLIVHSDKKAQNRPTS